MLTTRSNDIAAGLRILAGVGGREIFARRYREHSRALVAEGYRVGATSRIQALAVGLPAVFLAVVIWLSARMAASGDITVGEMVAVYGYVAMLVVPVSFFVEGAYDLTRGRVAARRIIDVLNLSPEHDEGRSGADLTDQASGLRAPGGRLLGLAAADPSHAIAITERLAGDKRLLLSTNDSYLFAGTVREVLQAGRSRTDAELWAALEVASADDVVMSLGEGELDAVVDAQGRNLSGGQRQRLRLARAIVVDPEILILVEPTSAVDADTETRIVRRVARQRAGRTTVIASTSPIVLHHVDTVAFVAAGKVVAVGTHHELLATRPDYRAMVSRSLADEDRSRTRPGGGPMSVENVGKLPIASSAQVRRVTLGLLRQDKRSLVIVVLLYLLATLAGLAGPYLMGRIVDGVRTGISVGTIDKCALIIGGFVLLQLFLTTLARYAGHRFGERILARLREDFIESTLRLPVSLVERAGTGELMTRSAVDVPNIGAAARDAVPEIFISGLQVLVILGAIFFLDPVLGVCGLVGVPGTVWVTRWYLRQARSAYLAEGEAMSVMTQELASTTQGARTVEALNLAEQRIAAADSSVGAAFARRRASLRLRTVFFPVVDFSHTLPVVLVLLVGGLLYGKGWITLGTVIAATLYLWQMVDPLDKVLQWAEQLQSGWASLARLTGVAEVRPASDVTSQTPQGETIRVERVRYAYGTAMFCTTST